MIAEDLLGLVMQSRRHVVGVSCPGEPTVVRQIGAELRRDETHLRRQLVDLFAEVDRTVGEVAIDEDHRLGAEETIFSAAETEDVDAGRHDHVAQSVGSFACSSDSVGKSGAVEVDAHPVCMSTIADGCDVIGGIERSPFGGLGDGDEAGLCMVHDPDIACGGIDGIGGEATIRCRSGEQFRAEDAFRCSCLVQVDMRPL